MQEDHLMDFLSDIKQILVLVWKRVMFQTCCYGSNKYFKRQNVHLKIITKSTYENANDHDNLWFRKRHNLFMYVGLDLWIFSNTFGMLGKIFNIVWTSNVCYLHLFNPKAKNCWMQKMELSYLNLLEAYKMHNEHLAIFFCLSKGFEPLSSMSYSDFKIPIYLVEAKTLLQMNSRYFSRWSVMYLFLNT